MSTLINLFENIANLIKTKWTAIDASINNKGIVQLSNDIDSDSSSTAATSNAVKQVYDLVNNSITTALAT